VLTSPFTDDEGRQAWKLERFLRWYKPADGYASSPWLMKDVWQVNADNKNVQVVEENSRYTKLSFPVKEGAEWNGNAFNSEAEELYRYEYVGRSETIGSQPLDRVLQVTERDFRTLISYEYRCEKYGAGVGLVFRNYTAIFSNNIVPGQPVEQRIEKGVKFTQTLISYGY
jgi:hypothetical protein